MTARLVRVTWVVPDATLSRLAAVTPELTVVGRDEDAPNEAVAALIGWPAGPPDAYPSLRWLQVPSAGVDAVDLGAWTGRGVTVTNARGVYAVPIAQYVLAAILSIAERHRVRAAQQATGEWPGDEAPFVGVPVRGATLALVGYGGIGREIARLASAHGMRVLAAKARPGLRTDDGFRLPGTGDPDGTIPERVVGMDDLATIAGEADYLVVTAPLTATSRGVVSEAVLAALPRHAWLINIARGPVADEAAILRALDTDRLAGAVLDVFAEEPLPPGHPFWTHPRVVVTPHIAGGPSDDAFEALVADNLARWAAGATLRNVVDPDRGY